MFIRLILYSSLLVSTNIFAASSQFIEVEFFIVKPESVNKVLPYAINMVSFSEPVEINSIKYLTEIDSDFIYSTRVIINNITYYRLVSGNYASLEVAQKQLSKVKQYYPDAWITIRQNIEKQGIKNLLSADSDDSGLPLTTTVVPITMIRVIPTVIPKKITTSIEKNTAEKKIKTTSVIDNIKNSKRKPVSIKREIVNDNLSYDEDFADKLLTQAKQLILDKNYARVITVSEKIMEIGSILQQQKAMEYSGISRERQRKFAQAIAIYKQFLDLYPDSKIAARIKIRLTGLRTMRLNPKVRLVKGKPEKVDDDWTIRGSVSQYYRDDVVDRESEDTLEVNSSLVSDVNVFARKKTDKSTLLIRFDAGVINDFIDKETESRISRVLVKYRNNESEYQLTAGRQSRTAKGVLGRFDGFVYKDFSADKINYSLYTGFPVQSSFDGLDSERQFAGSSINFKPGDKIEMDIYLVHQQIYGITDRQALGTEFQFRNEKGFLFGIIDYDFFYRDLNNITAISNYRYSDKLVFNLTYDYRNSPLLTTINALQGQSVETVEALQDLLSDKEIFQLAEDRTSKSQNLFFGSNYQIDAERQLFLGVSLSSTDETLASGGVAAVPAADDVNLSSDYSIKGFLSSNDFTTFGLRLSDTSSSEIISLRARSRLPGPRGFRYDPRLRLDFRKSKSSAVDQYILKPSLKVTYKPNRNINFEASLGIEYSNFDLPELNDQTQYDVFLGYVYRF